MNQLSPLQRSHLRLALNHLLNRDAARYRHQLWIGFGDRWALAERKLIQAGHIEHSEGACDRRLSATGRRLIGMLEESIVAA